VNNVGCIFGFSAGKNIRNDRSGREGNDIGMARKQKICMIRITDGGTKNGDKRSNV
jgi:hypothetical protein